MLQALTVRVPASPPYPDFFTSLNPFLISRFRVQGSNYYYGLVIERTKELLKCEAVDDGKSLGGVKKKVP